MLTAFHLMNCKKFNQICKSLIFCLKNMEVSAKNRDYSSQTFNPSLQLAQISMFFRLVISSFLNCL